MNFYDGTGKIISLINDDVLTGKTWLPIGDSLTTGGGYRGLLKNYKNLTEITGGYVDGRQIGYSRGKQHCILENLTNIGSGIPNFITIALGTNDFGNNCPIGNINDESSSQTTESYTFIGCYKKLIEHLNEKYPKTPIILFTPFQRRGGNGANTAGHKLSDYANAIREIGSYYSLEVCDLYSKSGLSIGTLVDNTELYYTTDGLHLIANAGEIILPKIIESLERAVKRIVIKATKIDIISNSGVYTLTDTNPVRIYANGEIGTERITWISDDENIVKVEPGINYIYANITAIANGQTTVRAVCEDVTATFNITVALN